MRFNFDFWQEELGVESSSLSPATILCVAWRNGRRGPQRAVCLRKPVRRFKSVVWRLVSRDGEREGSNPSVTHFIFFPECAGKRQPTAFGVRHIGISSILTSTTFPCIIKTVFERLFFENRITFFCKTSSTREVV